jgi:hypothetical protein
LRAIFGAIHIVERHTVDDGVRDAFQSGHPGAQRGEIQNIDVLAIPTGSLGVQLHELPAESAFAAENQNLSNWHETQLYV